MRCWHKDMIKALPRQQLLGQWRECCAIARNINKYGTPRHILVNRIMDYPIEHFMRYGQEVAYEMQRRGYKVDIDRFKCFNANGVRFIDMPTHTELFAGWHNDRYFSQCCANLSEKYDCGGITEDEWRAIDGARCDVSCNI